MLCRVEDCYAELNAALRVNLPPPNIRFDLRGCAAGQARLHNNTLRFNPVLLLENPDPFIREVVPHEVCHLAVHHVYGRVRPHGQQWRALMTEVFNLPASTTHRFNTHSVQGTTVPYVCRCGIIQLGIRRHNKVVKRQATYHCRTCKQVLVQS